VERVTEVRSVEPEREPEREPETNSGRVTDAVPPTDISIELNPPKAMAFL